MKQTPDDIEDLRRQLAAANARIAELESLVTIDPLTGLMNRRGLEESFQREIARIRRHQSPGAMLVMIDLDRFKEINDTYGHPAGDACLKMVSETLARAVRVLDGQARLGGDEFSLLLTHAAPEKLETSLQKIQKLLNDMVLDWNGEKIHVGASVGAAIVNEQSTMDDVYKAADRDLYQHKEQRHAAEEDQKRKSPSSARKDFVAASRKKPGRKKPSPTRKPSPS